MDDFTGSTDRTLPFSVIPPSRLTREEVSCLKTALALVVVKRRLDHQQQNKPKNPNSQNDNGASNTTHGAGGGKHPTSLCSLLIPPLTQASYSTTGGDSAASVPPNPTPPPPSTSNTPLPLPLPQVLLDDKEWATHLDHMMRVAQSIQPGGVNTKVDQYRSVIANIVRTMTSVLATCPQDDEHVEQWMYSYLVFLGEDGVAVWTDILYASQEKSLLRPEDNPTLIPTMMLTVIVQVLQTLLDSDDMTKEKCPKEEEEPTQASALVEAYALKMEADQYRADDFTSVRLLAHVIRYASVESVRQCWGALGVGSLGSWSGAAAYRDLCRLRRRDSTVQDSYEAPDAPTRDALRPLWLRLWIADVYAEYHQSETS